MLGGIAHWMHSQCHNTASSVQWLKIWLLFARWSVRIELSNYAFRQAGHMNNMKNVIGCCSPPSSSITAVIFSAISLTCSLFTAATANAVIDERGWHKGKLLGPHVYYTTWVWKERERERKRERRHFLLFNTVNHTNLTLNKINLLSHWEMQLLKFFNSAMQIKYFLQRFCFNNL